MPCLGKLSKGTPPQGDKGRPKELPYFRFVPEFDPVIRELWDALCPGEPHPEPGKPPVVPPGYTRRLQVFLPFESIDDNLQVAWMTWITGGLRHRCNDETAVVEIEYDPQAMSFKKLDPGTPVLCPWRTGARPRTGADEECKREGTLYFMIPQMGVGYLYLTTHANYDIEEMRRSLRGAEEFLSQLRAITGEPEYLNTVPFILSRVYKSQSSMLPGQGLVRVTRYPVKLMLDPLWTIEAQGRMRAARKQLIHSGQLRLSPPAQSSLPRPAEEEEDIIDVTPS